MSDRKVALRAELRRCAAELSPQQRQTSDELLVKGLLEHACFQDSERIFLYIGVRNEIDTRKMIETAVEQGKIVALPVSGPRGEMEFFRYDGNLTTGRLGIPEPTSGELLVPTEHDLLIVPGLAFDRRGYRLGQGGGYYDRYMARYPCRTVGLCREQFLLSEIPIAWNDLPVDIVITEAAVYGN